MCENIQFKNIFKETINTFNKKLCQHDNITSEF